MVQQCPFSCVCAYSVTAALHGPGVLLELEITLPMHKSDSAKALETLALEKTLPFGGSYHFTTPREEPSLPFIPQHSSIKKKKSTTYLAGVYKTR